MRTNWSSFFSNHRASPHNANIRNNIWKTRATKMYYITKVKEGIINIKHSNHSASLYKADIGHKKRKRHACFKLFQTQRLQTTSSKIQKLSKIELASIKLNKNLVIQCINNHYESMMLINYYNQRWESWIYPSRRIMKTKITAKAKTKGKDWVEYASNLKDRKIQTLICIDRH